MDEFKLKFNKGFSIVIPSWNNLNYLQLCIESIIETSELDHQIIVHLNEAQQHEEEYLKSKGIAYTSSPNNLGVAAAVNTAAKLATKDIFMYANDDFVFLPGWDSALRDFYNKYDFKDKIWLSSFMVEPSGYRPELIAGFNYGKSPQDFRKGDLLRDLPALKAKQPHRKGTTWPPNLMFMNIFNEIGGFSEEYFPGFGTDPDLAKKMWDIGIRNFISVSGSLVYHFQCITTRKVANTGDSHKIFQKKYGMTIDYFAYNVLGRGKVWDPDKEISNGN